MLSTVMRGSHVSLIALGPTAATGLLPHSSPGYKSLILPVLAIGIRTFQ